MAKVRRSIGTMLTALALLTTSAGTARADDPAPLPPPSVWDVADLAAQNATGGGPPRQPCEYPSAPFYYQDGDCKYAQAALYTSCSVQDSDGWCVRRRIDSALWRGGTADTRSYTPSGFCRLGSQSDQGYWQLTTLYVLDNSSGALLWSAPGADYALHSNCDVEHGPYARTIGVVVGGSATVEFEFRHYCRDDAPSCGGFPEHVTFGVVFSPRRTVNGGVELHVGGV